MILRRGVVLSVPFDLPGVVPRDLVALTVLTAVCAVLAGVART